VTLSPVARKLALTLHISASVGWLGAALGFLALAITGLTSADTQTVRGAYLAMDILARAVLLPLSLVSLLSGLLQALSTPWGLFRHYWVLVKLLLTVFATLVLILQLVPIRSLAHLAVGPAFMAAGHQEARLSLVVHSAGGSLVLLLITALSVLKPRGTTGFGQRSAIRPAS
jgi:hypothetical protein